MGGKQPLKVNVCYLSHDLVGNTKTTITCAAELENARSRTFHKREKVSYENILKFRVKNLILPIVFPQTVVVLFWATLQRCPKGSNLLILHPISP